MIQFYADAGSNHNQDFQRAIELVNAAKRSGSTGIKFQVFKAEKLYRDPAKWPELRKRELPAEWIPELSKHARSLGLQFGVTPFDMVSLAACAPYCDFIKISSFDVLRFDLVKAVGEIEMPIIISIGLCTKDEQAAIKYIVRREIKWLYCISKYPARIEDIDFTQFADNDGWRPVSGYSDHTANPLTIKIAARLFYDENAIIEYHLDLDDMAGAESHIGHVWSESKIMQTIKEVRELEACNFETYKPDLSQRADPSDGLRPML
jgi:sialic acid synthase SpsE